MTFGDYQIASQHEAKLAKQNVDAKLLKLAQEHKARLGTLRKGARARRCFIRGQASKLIAEHYPVNAEIIQAEWNKLAH